jgi:hypothetical protein
MAADQKNFNLFTYVDDNAVSWNKKGEDNAIINTLSGSSAKGAHPMWPRRNRRWQARTITYQDPTTFRTKRVVFYTAAAFAAIVLNTGTIALHVEGETATVTYTAVAKNAEKQPGSKQSPSLADHA